MSEPCAFVIAELLAMADNGLQVISTKNPFRQEVVVGVPSELVVYKDRCWKTLKSAAQFLPVVLILLTGHLCLENLSG